MPTTLELARRLAEAAAHPVGDCTPAQAILAELDRNRCWFVRVREVEGLTVEQPLRRPKLKHPDVPLPFDV
jgi:hypothetical protein